jgi:NADH-quinone oxidoreductase subunit H
MQLFDMSAVLGYIQMNGQHIFGANIWAILWNLAKIVLIVLPLFACVAYLTLWERKLIGWMQVRIGPNRVGYGLLQPIADALKLLLKEIIVPFKANKILYIVAPVMVIMPAFAAWAVVPFANGAVLANIDAGLLYIMSITSVGVYGIILAGWASNSKYPLLAAMRASAQMVSYELAMGLGLAGVLIISNSLNLQSIVAQQQLGWFANKGINFLSWNWLPLLPLFMIYFISGIAETNRHPFDVVEGESEIVAGHMIEYSGMAFAMFFLAEYASMILVCMLTSLLFLGGWSAPLGFLDFIPGFIWLIAKVFFLLSVFIWIRASFPRYRYDQIMRLGWKVFIPLALVWIIIIGAWRVSAWSIW